MKGYISGGLSSEIYFTGEIAAMWMITITHYINRGFEIESKNKFGKIFSTKENAEKWLVKEGFVYGKNDCFKSITKFIHLI